MSTCNYSVFKLVLQRIDINRKRIASVWRCELRLIHGFEVIAEITAAFVHLSRFKPVHVVVYVAHLSSELLVSNIQTGQTLRDCSPFPAGKWRGNLLIFTHDRPRNRIGLDNKHEQITAQLTQRHLLAWRNLALRKFVKRRYFSRI